ncbi:MAG TPA: iron ABC transporter permease [Acidimicrobiia bacterium]|jgi:iron(III) transport system permease protein
MRAARPAVSPWSVVVLGVAALVVLPVVMVAAEVFTPTPSVWRHLWETRLPTMLTSTVALLVLVGVGTLALGVSLAWLVSAYRFPGRSVFRFALVLPLAMPGYVLGYVFLTTFSFAGPVQSTLRGWFGRDVWFPEVRSLPGAATVLVLTLYPYVYVLAMTALREQGLRTWQVARTLGQGRLRAARRAVLPAARPTLAAALALVMMEVLTDFATVQYFNVETVSVGIFRVWKGMGDRAAATELAVLVLAFALAVIALERAFRGRARFHQAGAKEFLEPLPLQGWRRWGATGACLAILSGAFLLPVVRLATWSRLGGLVTARGYLEHLSRSALLAGMAAVACLVVAALVTSGARLSGGRTTRWAARSILVGYTLPGTVVAIGVLVVFNATGNVRLATITLLGVLYAYTVRFVPLATATLDASLEKVTPSVVMAARTLGARPGRILARIHAPLLRSGMTAALLLVFVHTLQEISIVLLLRPFGFDTLSVWVWDLTANSAWEQTGLPALTIVAVALVPVILTMRASAGSDRQPVWERALAEPALTPPRVGAT